ncbi:MAG: acetoacetate decarboxylase [Alphaproteobacteria bacterium]|nr:acetoacetate decarboxylase [Alphaproteobacteria bacterium]
MNRDQILQLPSMPAAGPSYPKGPYRFINREYLIITYESDPDAIRAALPEPLEPAPGNTVAYEFMKMPDSSGFGAYSESGVTIPCLLNGEKVGFIAQMYLDDEPPISGGREVWGFPKKYGNPKLEIVHDTLTGTLKYAGQLVALGTMGYKHENMLYDKELLHHCNPDKVKENLGRKQLNLKFIPHVDGTPAIAQLVSYHMTDIDLKGAWAGPAKLHLIPHVNAPVADLPVRRIIGGSHFIADMTLPYGKVEIDYLA